MANVLVTGCSDKGIGYYTVEVFAEAGHKVYATVRANSRHADLDALANREDVDIELIELDVTDEIQVDKARDYILSKGDLDVLVNNAGRAMICPIEDANMADVRAIYEVNVFGTMNMVKAFSPAMRTNNSGTIINVSSPATLKPWPLNGIYGSSKAAVEQFSMVLQKELADWNIRVIVIVPGNFKTPVVSNSAAFGVSKESPFYDLSQRANVEGKKLYNSWISPEEKQQRETARPVGEAILQAMEDRDSNKVFYPVGTEVALMLDKIERIE